MDFSMHAYVVERLNQEKGRWRAIATASGVSKRTLEKIARREIVDPGVSHIEKLFTTLRSEERPQ